MNPPMGMIQGGWPYVVAAYSITWLTLLGYGASLWWRRRQAEKAR
jgi:CcmD family protein